MKGLKNFRTDVRRIRPKKKTANDAKTHSSSSIHVSGSIAHNMNTAVKKTTDMPSMSIEKRKKGILFDILKRSSPSVVTFVVSNA